MKKAIIFDLDNTLYDYDLCHKNGLEFSYKYLKEKYNVSFEDYIQLYNKVRKETHKELSGVSSSHNRIIYFKKLFMKLSSNFDSEFIISLYNSYYDGFFNQMELFNGIEEVFEYLSSNNLKIAITTNLNSMIQLKKIEHLNISKYLDAVITSEEALREKPHSSIFLKTLHVLNVKTNEALMVGDNLEKDIKGATSLGIDSILFDKNGDYKLNNPKLDHPFHIIQDMNLLKQKLIELLSE